MSKVTQNIVQVITAAAYSAPAGKSADASFFNKMVEIIYKYAQ